MEFLKRKTLTYTLQLLIVITFLVLINLLARHLLLRFDLTEENRYSMSDATTELLSNLDETVYVEVYLAGDINAEFKRLQTAIQQTLDQFKTYSRGNVQYNFINPDAASSANARNEYYNVLIDKGINPTTVFDNIDGKKTQKLIFPGAEISYKGRKAPVILLNGNNAAGAKEAINQSVENLEYQLAITINNLASNERKKIALVQGHQEASGEELYGLRKSLQNKFDLQVLTDLSKLNQFDGALFIKPQQNFSNTELFDVDQYIMNGGKALFFLDGLSMSVDSIKDFGAMALPIQNNLDELLFKYGVRVNDDIIQDVNSGNFPIVTGNLGSNAQVQLLPWPYYIIFNKYAKHPIVNGLNAVYGKFVSSLDTLAVGGIEKTPLIFTSDYSRTLQGPVLVNFESLKEDMQPDKFNQANIPVAYLLEGEFSSAFKNRLAPTSRKSAVVIKRSASNKIIVVGDGDMVLNTSDKKTGKPFELGVDPYARHATPFANEQLLLNMLNYMLDDEGLIIAKNKDFKIRPLDKVKLREDKLMIQLINIVLPVLLIVAFGVIRYWWRKRKYTNF
ncbi:gliding motility-associated ABC transporter substrate-binding protein GldG [Marivirga atlantica]|uniref:Gliding motility-associated ABC transporter substrate-binding protein GldG n=1 Tax=Marivirga atlantica TaxID=1548457 RepID=A0A937DI65_9BACT|nr:gliding motility-associated ABC transporter substrate-binding protein GldG [Marivirga atlantica]MBL0766668.1 gliding motility-associated ABC transporter substrate-binding protein GldG [Marivirga atlantica]